MENKAIQLNYAVLTICYIFSSYYVIHGVLLHDIQFGFTKMPTGPEISIANILIVLGLNSVLITAVGCHAIPDKMLFLAWHALSSIVIVAILLVIGLELTLKFRSLDQTIATNMYRSIQAYNIHSHQKALIDIVQKRRKCCGIYSADDWLPLSGVPRSCIIPGSKFDKILLEAQLKDNLSLNETGLIDITKFPKESLKQFLQNDGCYYSYRQTASNNFKIIIVVIVLNCILLGTSIIIETLLFIESARREEAKCLDVVAAFLEIQKNAVRQKNDFNKHYKSAPTNYNESYDNIQFTESELNIIYPKTRLKRFLHRLLYHRKELLRKNSRRRVENQDEKYESAMIHWMHYF